jgi:hypothetical protein
MGVLRFIWLTAPIPVVMFAATVNHGDSTFYWRVSGIVGMVLLACMALARVLAWYVFRFGRHQVSLASGGEVLLLAEALSVPDFKGMMSRVRNGRLAATGKVIDIVSADQRKYYGFDEAAFPQPSPYGRVMLPLSFP